MIGYYAHHLGAGHVTRAAALAAHLPHEVTGLSSAPRPADWEHLWIELEPDDSLTDGSGLHEDPTAGGVLHWAPLHHAGLRSRMATISRWIEAMRPRLMVVDVSVEVALLCRLHGVPVVTMLQPGERDDAPHALGYRMAERLVAPWPADASDLVRGVDPDDDRLVHVGAVSRFDGRSPEPRAARPPGVARSVVVLSGLGGSALTASMLERARAATPGWDWTVVGGPGGTWHDDPWDLLVDADVVVTHAGQNALAEVAAARRPAVIVPQERPHEEQRTTATALRRDGRWPVVSLEDFPDRGWASLLELAAGLDGDRWARWNDGAAGARFAKVVMEAMGR